MSKAISLMLSTIIMMRAFVFKFDVGVEYFILMLVVFTFLVFRSGRLRLSAWPTILLMCCVGSIVLNEVPEFFRAPERLLAFAIVLATVGPLVDAKLLSQFKVSLFDSINRLNVILVICSLLSILLRLPFSSGESGNTGLFSHSMILGPFAALAALYSYQKFHVSVDRAHRIQHLLIILIGISTCLAAGSRAALLGLSIAMAAMTTIYYRRYSGKLATTGPLIILALIATAPIWFELSTGVQDKFVYSAGEGSIFISRINLWENRLIEFESSPIFGIGFASVAEFNVGWFDLETGGVEPGSSWLGVLSMTGLLGASSLIILLSKQVQFIVRGMGNNSEYTYLFCVTVFMFMHMFFEGYIFAAGSTLGLYFWLTLGVIGVRMQRSRDEWKADSVVSPEARAI
jgi:O-antigen ligase